jgi:hypothetical protein
MTPILGIIASSFRSAAGPDGAYDALATVTVPSGNLSTITFAGIPNTYKHLQLRAISQSPNARLGIAFNGDSTISNYSAHYLYGTGSTAAAGYGANTWSLGANVNPSSPTNTFGVLVSDILDYANTSKNKVWRSMSGADENGSGIIIMYSGLWRNTAAINSITIYGAESNTGGYLFAGSQFTLYGIK